MLRLTLIILALMVSACSGGQYSGNVAPAKQRDLMLHTGDMNLDIMPAAHWHAYRDESRVVLAENENPLDREGNLHGAVITIWSPQANAKSDTLVSWLSGVVSSGDAIGRAVTSQPQAFTWSRGKGAFYTLNTYEQQAALVVVLHADDAHDSFAFNLSLSAEAVERLPTLLQEILQDTRINGYRLQTNDLRWIPDTFFIPAYPAEAAMEASPIGN